MIRKITRLLIWLALSLGASFLPITSSFQANAWQERVDAWVLKTAQRGKTEFLIFLTDQADLSRAASLPTKLEKTRYVYETLSAAAASSQKPVIEKLNALGMDYRPYWVANMVWVRAGEQTLSTMAQRPDVAHIFANPAVYVDPSGEQIATPGAERPALNDNITAPDGVEFSEFTIERY